MPMQPSLSSEGRGAAVVSIWQDTRVPMWLSACSRATGSTEHVAPASLPRSLAATGLVNRLSASTARVAPCLVRQRRGQWTSVFTDPQPTNDFDVVVGRGGGQERPPRISLILMRSDLFIVAALREIGLGGWRQDWVHGVVVAARRHRRADGGADRDGILEDADERCRVMRRRLSRSEQLVRSRSRAKSELHAVLMRRLNGRPPMSDLFGVKGRRWLGELEFPVDEQETVDGCLRHIEFLDWEIAEVERLIATEALRSAEIRRLMTVPGVNMIAAATFMAAVGNIRRFRTQRQLVGYHRLSIAVASRRALRMPARGITPPGAQRPGAWLGV